MAAELIALGPRDPRSPEPRSPTAGRRSSRTYQKRLTERIQSLLHGQGVTVEPNDLAREVAILADRCDISEEIVRLRAHLSQYHRDHRRAAELGPEARVRGPGNGARDQHDRLQGQRRADQPLGRGGQGSAGKDSRAGPKCRVNGRVIGRNLPGRLIVISGPSGSGKSTLVAASARAGPSCGCRSRSRRPPASPRPGEAADRDYFFLSHGAVRADPRRPARSAQVHGHSYGTPAEPVRRAMAEESVCCW